MRHQIILFAAVLVCSVAWGQTQTPSNTQTGQQSMPAMDMSNHDMSKMKDTPATDKEDSETSAHVMQSMEGHMDMGPHMK